MAERLTKKLTVKQIESLRPKARPYETLDGDGLYVTVRPNGSKSFNLRYRFGGRSKNLTIGLAAIGLAEARRLAQEARAEIARGNDPCSQKAMRVAAAKVSQQPARDSIAEIVDLFLEKHVKPKTRPNSARETERLLRREIVARWGDRKLSTVSRGDVRRLLEETAERAPVLSNRVLAAFRKLCGWAVERDIIVASPCDKLKPVAAENSRDRVLSDDELAAVWRAVDGLGFPFGPMFQLLALTGQRRSEVAGMTWAEVDLASALWTIPAARSKNGLEHRVPLSPQAVKIIAALPRFAGGQGFLFSSGDTPPSGFSRAKRRLDDALSTMAKASGDDGMPPFALHDLRRTAVSGMARLGVALPIIERVVNHISGSFAGVVGVYQKHQFDDEKRAALNAWGAHVEALAGGAQ
ncbi:site-specific integrase [Methylocystis sp. ATCC 49242]|uniref:tyrosine-type recombinase/integrase n=1 Tax=Methylocystis sp. ATCC 49242 TaxID=622637 RepID=UPI0001F86877|nr:site-specific integrase [Methylocystis sp. ATCC 49242]